jgi:peroxiredoxin Q/BCP
VAYFTVSVDDAKTNAEFARHVEADYPILADPTKATANAYGVLGMVGFASRWTFYIDKDGRIAYIDKAVRVASAGQDIADTLGRLGVAKR